MFQQISLSNLKSTVKYSLLVASLVIGGYIFANGNSIVSAQSCPTQLNPQGLCPTPTPAPQSCPDDVRYCDVATGRMIWKHGGVWRNNQCVYAFDDVGSCAPTPTPAPQGGNPAPAQQAPTATPVPAVVTAPSGISASCPDGSRAEIRWNPASKTGQTVINYTVRINKEPFDVWAPNDGVSGDLAWENGPITFASRNLPSGRYGGTITAGFSDMSVSEGVQMPIFSCSQAVAPTATPTPPAPTATPTPPAPTATPVPGVTTTPTPTPTPLPQGARTDCPTGQVLTIQNSQFVCVAIANTNNNTNNNYLTVNNPPAAPLAKAGAPAKGTKVAGVSYPVKELPKTGLPLLAWAFSGLLPLGFGLKRLTGKEGEDVETGASYIWQRRQYLKD